MCPERKQSWILFISFCCIFSTKLPAAEEAVASSDVAKSSWAEVVSWPDLQGGIWHADKADGAPHAEDLPLKPEIEKLQQQLADKFWSGELAGSCKPRGMPRHLGNQFIYSSGMIVILGQSDYYQVVRRVYMDHQQEMIEPAYFGTSNGHWEDGTLVIETTGFWPDQDLTDFVPGYGETSVIERYRLLEPGRMELQLTVKNPAVLTEPYQTTRIYTLQPGEQVLESYCTNNRDLSGGRVDMESIH